MTHGAACAICRREIDPRDPDAGEAGGRPICGECARARHDDELLWVTDAEDGELDGEVG